MTSRCGLAARLATLLVIVWLVAPPALAASFEFNVESPSIAAIRKSLAERFASLSPYLDNGTLGLTWDGNVALREAQGLPAEVRKAVDALVADENKDRLTLIREIARANGRPDWEENLRHTFAQRWIQRAPFGWYYRESSGLWVRKSSPPLPPSTETSR